MIVNADSTHIPLASNTVQCIVTSPPYYMMRDYQTATWVGGDPDCKHYPSARDCRVSVVAPGHGGIYTDVCPECGAVRTRDRQVGIERTLGDYIAALVGVFRECRRVLRDDGLLWLNIGDIYSASGGSGGDYNAGGSKHGQPRVGGHQRTAGLPPKNLVLLPARLALALQDDGWILRSEIVWAKPNPKPDGVMDRPTVAHEYIYMLAKSPRYYYDKGAIAEQAVSGGTRNRRSVWTIPVSSGGGKHYATFPVAIPERCIMGSTRPGDIVLDPFCGSGTTLVAAKRLHRRGIGLDLSATYLRTAQARLRATPVMFPALV